MIKKSRKSKSAKTQFRWVVMAPGISDTELDDLKNQIKKSFADPDRVIVTNYEIIVTQIPIFKEG